MKAQRRDGNLSFAKMFPTIAGKLCSCGCNKRLTGRKTRWLNHKHFWKCYVQYALKQGDSAIVRQLVWERDKGICSKCGINCEKEKKYWQETARLWLWLAEADNDALLERERDKHQRPEGFYAVHNNAEFRTRWLHARWLVQQEILKASGRKRWDGHAWEAHHKKAVSEGGRGCGLSGYETVCILCHKRLTKMLVRRLARKRQNQQSVLAF